MVHDFEQVLTWLFDYYVDFEGDPKISHFVKETADRNRFLNRSSVVWDDALYGVAAAGQPEVEGPALVVTGKNAQIGL